jgi:hypothetical protein
MATYLIPMLLVFVSSFELNVQYSSLSGVVGDFEVGIERRPVRMSLDFSGDPIVSPFLHSQANCPSFVPSCYDLEASRSAVVMRGMISDRLLENEMIRSGFDIYETVFIGDESFPKNHFFYLSSVSVRTALFRDAGGLVMFARRESSFTDNRVLVLKRRTNIDGFTIQSSDSPSASAFPLMEGRSDWSFIANLSIRDTLIAGNIGIIFDPAIQELSIPVSLKDSVLASWRLIDPTIEFNAFTGYVAGDCDSKIAISIGTGTIRNEQLFHPKWSSWRISSATGLTLCPFAVTFHSSEDETVRVGRQLVYSVEALVLDNIQGGIEIIPSGEIVVSSFPVRALVPIFRHPVVSRQANGFTTVTFERQSVDSIQAGLIPVSFQPLRRGDELIWNFLRTEPKENLPVSVSQIGLTGDVFWFPEHQALLSSDLLNGELRLSLQSYPSSQQIPPGSDRLVAEIVLSDRMVRIEVKTAPTAVTIDMLDLPDLVVHSTTQALNESVNAEVSSEESSTIEEEERCAICLIPFLEGDVKQNLRSCDHGFHQHCITRWLEGGRLTCPMCRAEVHRK